MDSLVDAARWVQNATATLGASVSDSLRVPEKLETKPYELGWQTAVIGVLAIILLAIAWVFLKKALVYIKEAVWDGGIIITVTTLVYFVLLTLSIVCPKSSFETFLLWAWGHVDQLALKLGLKPVILSLISKYITPVG